MTFFSFAKKFYHIRLKKQLKFSLRIAVAYFTILHTYIFAVRHRITIIIFDCQIFRILSICKFYLTDAILETVGNIHLLVFIVQPDTACFHVIFYM